jgi:hypothetical protein
MYHLVNTDLPDLVGLMHSLVSHLSCQAGGLIVRTTPSCSSKEFKCKWLQIAWCGVVPGCSAITLVTQLSVKPLACYDAIALILPVASSGTAYCIQINSHNVSMMPASKLCGITASISSKLPASWANCVQYVGQDLRCKVFLQRPSLNAVAP